MRSDHRVFVTSRSRALPEAMWQDPVNSFVSHIEPGTTEGLYIMPASAIDSAGRGTTEDIFSARRPPSHQYAPRSRGLHRAMFAPRPCPVLWSAKASHCLAMLLLQ